jgi:ElaB/YqjD/DUF883 family membrane-anchored ribosome-binding protein
VDKMSNVSQQGRGAIDKAADTIQSGIDRGSATVSDGVEAARSQAKSAIGKISDHSSAAVQQVRDTATQASDSIIDYTRTNPVKALMIAAAAGALLLTVIKVLTPSRD